MNEFSTPSGCPRYRVVTIDGVPFYLFYDALFRVEAVASVRSKDPTDGREIDTRGVVEARARDGSLREFEAEFFPPEDDPDESPAVLMGFKVQFGSILFDDGATSLGTLAAVVRRGDLAAVYGRGFREPRMFRTLPYPWERPA